MTSLSLPLAAAAQSEHLAHHDGTAATKPDTPMANGVVRKVDNAAGSGTIAHQALTNLGIPKMTTAFLVKEREWLDDLQKGSRINAGCGLPRAAADDDGDRHYGRPLAPHVEHRYRI